MSLEYRNEKIKALVKSGMSRADVATLYKLSVSYVYRISAGVKVFERVPYKKQNCRQKPIKDYGAKVCVDCGLKYYPASGNQLRCRHCRAVERRARYERTKNKGTKA